MKSLPGTPELPPALAVLLDGALEALNDRLFIFCESWEPPPKLQTRSETYVMSLGPPSETLKFIVFAGGRGWGRPRPLGITRLRQNYLAHLSHEEVNCMQKNKESRTQASGWGAIRWQS